MRNWPALAIGGSVALAVYFFATSSARSAPTVASTHVQTSLSSVLKRIASQTQAVESDPKGAIGWRLLSDSLLHAAELTDSDEFGKKALQAAERSFSLRQSNNSAALHSKAKALLQQHRFKEAFETAVLASKIEPSPASDRLVTDCALEIGQYKIASSRLAASPPSKDDAGGMVQTARLYEVRGQVDEARKLYVKATEVADRRLDWTDNSAAWYHEQLGLFELKYGNLKEAESALKSATMLSERRPRALAGLAKIAARRQQFDLALQLCDQSLNVFELTDVQWLKADILDQLGKKDESEPLVKKIREENGVGHSHGAGSHVHEGRHTHNRLFLIGLLARKEDPKLALHLAQGDYHDRQDITAAANLALAYSRNGRMAEAKKYLGIAMATGSKDPFIESVKSEVAGL